MLQIVNPIAEAYKKHVWSLVCDIVVHSAGLAIFQTLEETTEKDWDILRMYLVKGQFELANRAVAHITQAMLWPGWFISIGSKNGLVSGPKQCGLILELLRQQQQHMAGYWAAELGGDRSESTTINPWMGSLWAVRFGKVDWAEGRAKAYELPVDELLAHYAPKEIFIERKLFIQRIWQKVVFGLFCHPWKRQLVI